MVKRNSNSVWEMDRAHVLHPYTDFNTFKSQGSQVIEFAEGVYVKDSEGRKLLDGIAGLWCVNIGHGRKEMAEAISKQVLTMDYYNPFGHSTNVPAAELGAWLAEHSPGNLNHVYYTTGGSTANDAAIRIVHYYFTMKGQYQKKAIISRNDAYHGATYVAAELTGIHATKNSFDRVGQNFIHHISAANMYAKPSTLSEEEYCDFLVKELEDRILQLGPSNVAAFIAEPIMGAGGVLVAPRGYHKRMWEICKKYEMLYIADEVVTGFGRLGEWFASEAVFGYQPDIIVTAKGITSGYIPLGAVLISDEIYEIISRPQSSGGLFSMGLTYFGHPVACAAALKNVEIIQKENLLNHSRTVGAYFQKQMNTLADLPFVGDVRGYGLMLAVDMVADKVTKENLSPEVNVGNRIFEVCVRNGAIVRPVGNRIILSPPIIITNAQVDFLVSTLRESILEVGNQMELSGEI